MTFWMVEHMDSGRVTHLEGAWKLHALFLYLIQCDGLHLAFAIYILLKQTGNVVSEMVECWELL